MILPCIDSSAKLRLKLSELMRKNLCIPATLLGIFMIVSCQQSAQPKTHVDAPAPPSKPARVNEAVFVEADAGRTWNIFGLEIVGKIMSEQTNGDYAVIMSSTPPEGGPPPHVHQHEDEVFYVLEGNYSFICGEKEIQASKGDLVHLPRGIPHSFRNIGNETGVLLNTITPGGFEKFFEEVDRLPKDQPLDRAKVEEIAAKYALKFLPPPANGE